MLLLLSLSIRLNLTSAITCTDFAMGFATCIPYSFGITSYPSRECCESLSRWVSSIKSTRQRQRGCLCFKLILNMRGINDARLATLPKICGVNLGFPISRSTHCSRVKGASDGFML
ncbi:non-specific lipid-transfer protein 3-like [Phalaenopsis equestris]|uniref:non-specific lipid-transfer protein 3-like n=1 Tax=Phalaenopsis equestris TaxID=78828 RepID=UPI0009E4CBBF|nr:non-specific lipid-transfer protein 3-like [Phalaenopsis equestris]